jgi:hypothetical protein
MRNVEAKPT